MGLRPVIGLVVALLPSSRVKNWFLSHIPGWTVAENATVRPCLLFNIERLEIGEGARVGFFSIVRNMRGVTLEAGATVGQWNWVSADPRLTGYATDPRSGTLHLGAEASITSRHYIDCSGGVSVGERSIVAGHRTTIITHAIDFQRSVQRTAPVAIGEACFIATNSTITGGVAIADHVIVGAGSVVVRDLDKSEQIYAGVPAVAKRSIAGAAYFQRQEGHVYSEGHPLNRGTV